MEFFCCKRLFLTFLGTFSLHIASKAVLFWASLRAWETTLHMKSIFSVLQAALGQQCSTNDHDEKKKKINFDSRKGTILLVVSLFFRSRLCKHKHYWISFTSLCIASLQPLLL